MTVEGNGTVSDTIFAGTGEMHELMRSFNWAQTPLGSLHQWPQSLRTAVSICLNSRFPMVIWWGQELVLLYNDAWMPILGNKHPKALGQPGRAVWAEIWDIIGLQLNDVLRTGEATWSNDMLLPVCRYGYVEEAYFTYSYSPIFTETGTVGGAFTAVTETTERVIGERRLRTLRAIAASTEAKTVEDACRATMEAIAQNSHDLPFALLYLVENNGSEARLVGTAGIEAGTDASPEYVDLTLEGDRWKLATVKRTGQVECLENLRQRFNSLPTGPWNEAPHTALVMPLAQSGKPQLAGFLVLGVSPRRALGDKYRGFFDLLTNNVVTAIANADAYEAERRRAEALAELDQAKTTFFSNISHEFRTPLTLMLGSLEETLTGDERLSLKQRNQLEMAQRNSLRLLKLVNTLLDFSRIEADRIQGVYEPIDLSTFTTDLASAFRSAVERAGMQLIIDCPPLAEPVYVDREMWEKIVLNLLSNAFKFTFEGEITVTLKLAAGGGGDRGVELASPSSSPSSSPPSSLPHVVLEVRDTGIGIPAVELPRLFDRFHQVQGVRRRTYEGSGIGLSLVQELVQLHGGTVSVTSTEGQGSCFTVSIPTGLAHLPPDRIGAVRTLASTATSAAAYVEEALHWTPEGAEEQGNKELEEQGRELSLPCSSAMPSASILLVDDNADMRDYVQRLLSPYYAVKAVGDGLAALELVRQQAPDLVLTDVMMPRIDGLGLLRSLRNDPATQNIPIILLSARAGEESRLKGLQAGADDYLCKPFSARELLVRVESTLKLAQLRQESIQRERELRAISEAAQCAAEVAKAKLESTLASIKDQFLVLDNEWRYVYINDRVVETIDQQREEVIGRNIWELFPDTIGSEFYIQAHRAVAEQTNVQCEYFYPTFQRWFENRIYPSEEGVTVLVTDVTDRRKAEQALQESEERFRQLAENIETVFFMSEGFSETSAGEILYVSPAYERMWGRSCESLYQDTRSWVEAIHPDDREAVEQALPGLARAEFDQEFRIVRPDGEIRWVHDRVFPVYNEQGKLYRLVGIVADITDRKRAEAALRQSEARYRYLVESIPQLVWTANTEGVLLDVNQRWTNYTGLTLARVQSNGWQAIIHPDDIPILNQHWTIAQQTGTYYQAEGRIRRVDGMYRWHLHQAVPLKNERGQVIKWFGTATDIEDQKQLEQQRARILKREQAAREEAEAANRIKDEFLAVLSHELRSPLNPILGWAKLLRSRKFDEQATDRALETIERNAKLQTQLIEDLLDISRILRGKMALSITPVDLLTTIEAASETVRLAAEAKGIHIQKKLNPTVGQVAGDAARLQQIVWNLLSNAVKFTPAGGSVEICLDQMGSYAQIQIRDTGKGITPQFLPHLFKYFHQEDSTTTRRFGGLGLGLAIVRHLTELHGGIVSAESLGEGQGSTLTVQLPLMTGSPKLPQTSEPSATAVDLKGLQILAVDDETDIRDLVAFVLEQAGAEVRVAASAPEALALIKQSLPNVLVCDIGMPTMDGYMLIHQIRALSPEQGGQIPAIALTAYAGELNQQKALAAGFQQHLAKPIEPDELINAIAKLMETHGNGSALCSIQNHLHP